MLAPQIAVVAEILTSVLLASAAVKGLVDTIKSLLIEQKSKSINKRERAFARDGDAEIKIEELKKLYANVREIESDLKKIIVEEENLTSSSKDKKT